MTIRESTMGASQLTTTAILRHGIVVHPDAEVVTYAPDGSVRQTYARVGRRAERLAAALAGMGVDRGDCVATMCWNHAEHLEAYFAVPGLGAVLLTLNLRLGPDQLDFIVRDARPKVLLVDEDLVDLAAPLCGPHSPIDHVVVVRGQAHPGLPGAIRYDELVEFDGTFAWPELYEDLPAVMCYTTGTTGAPKGVVYSHRSTYLHALAIAAPNVFDIGERTRALVIVPMFHAAAWGTPYACFFMGADQLMPARHLQGEHLARFAADEAATFTAAVPSVLADMSRAAAEGEIDLSSLALVIGGGSAVPRRLIEDWEARHGGTLYQAWGMTETSPVAAIARPPRAPVDGSWRAKTGRPVPGVELRIVDDSGAPVPTDGMTVGELQARGPWVTARYFRDAGADRFEGDWLRTGDVGHMDGGRYVQLTDRAKDVIKSGGEWISSLALEDALQSHPAVIEAGVIGVADDRWQERPLACVVLQGSAPTFEELAGHLRTRVPRWWIPERWALVGALPRTSVGKIDKVALREAAAGLDVHTISPARDRHSAGEA